MNILIDLCKKYYSFFQWENGENTCFAFTFVLLVIIALTMTEIVCKITKKKSLFF